MPEFHNNQNSGHQGRGYSNSDRSGFGGPSFRGRGRGGDHGSSRPPGRNFHSVAINEKSRALQVNSDGARIGGGKTAPVFGILDVNSRAYFKRIQERLDLGNEFDSVEESESFLASVYSEIHGNELKLSADFECSVIIEKILRISSNVHIRIFMDKLSGNYVTLFQHFCASHVCQTLLACLFPSIDLITKQETKENDDGPEGLPSALTLFLNMCSQLRSYWNVLVCDRHASFLVRMVLRILNGEIVHADDSRTKSSRKWGVDHNNLISKLSARDKPKQNVQKIKIKGEELPISFITTKKEAIEEILGTVLTGQFGREKLTDVSLSGFLETLFDVAENKDQIALWLLGFPSVESILECSNRGIQNGETNNKSTGSIEAFMYNRSASRWFEKLIEHVSTPLYDALVLLCFKGKFKQHCRDGVANYVVQALIAHSRNISHVKTVIEELETEYLSLVFIRAPLVVVRLLEAAARFSESIYSDLDKNKISNNDKTLLLDSVTRPLQNAIGAGSSFFRAIFFLNNNNTEDQSFNPAPAGLNMLVCLATRFPPTHWAALEVVKGLAAEMTRKDNSSFIEYAMHPIGSQTIQTIIESKTCAGDPRRDIQRALLQGDFGARLASDKCGSHVLEALWRVGNSQARERIANALSGKSATIQSSHYGRMVWRNLDLSEYEKNSSAWKSRQKSIEISREQFATMVEMTVKKPITPDVISDPVLIEQKNTKKTKRKKVEPLLKEEIDGMSELEKKGKKKRKIKIDKN